MNAIDTEIDTSEDAGIYVEGEPDAETDEDIREVEISVRRE